MGNIYHDKFVKLDHSMVTDPEASDFVLHVHDCYEILCYVSGNATYLVEGREYPMYPGCLMIMRPAETHKLIVRGKGDYDRYVLHFYADTLSELGMDDSLLTAFTERSLGEKNQYLSSEFGAIDPLDFFRQIETECKVLDPRQAMLSNFVALLCSVNAVFMSKEGGESVVEEDDIGKKLIWYVNENLTQEISLDSISEYIHMSPSQVNRVFRKLTGTSVYDYILSKRLIMAQKMISMGEGSISASQKCGFKDYSSFYRLYKKRMGGAPCEAKKR